MGNLLRNKLFQYVHSRQFTIMYITIKMDDALQLVLQLPQN
jgi:hypothetical protein